MKINDFRYDLLPLKDKLFRLALRITLDRAEAEDTVQDTLLRIWNKRDELVAVESLEAYSLTVCRNLSLDRKARKEAQNLSLDETGADAPDTTRNAEDELIGNERRKWVHRLFNALPEKQRTVMHLRDIEGKSTAETAAVLQMSEADVKTTLFRARQAIRDQFSKIESYGL